MPKAVLKTNAGAPEGSSVSALLVRRTVGAHALGTSRYGQHCPVARSLKLLGDRGRCWPGELEPHRLLDHHDDRHRPAQACDELRPLISGLAEWGGRWAFGQPQQDEPDPTVLMWWIRGRIDATRFDDKRVVLQVKVPDAHRSRFWFVVQADDVSLCFTDPGFDVDITVEGPLSVLHQVWNGVIEPLRAIRDGVLTLDGRRDLIPLLPGALRSSPFQADVLRVRT